MFGRWGRDELRIYLVRLRVLFPKKLLLTYLYNSLHQNEMSVDGWKLL